MTLSSYARASAVLALAAVAGCSGSSALRAGPPLAPGATATATPSGAAPAAVAVAFRIVVPAKGSATSAERRPAYVSVATQSASVTVSPQSGAVGAPVVFNCTNNVCAGQVPAAIGLDSFSVKLFDQPNGAGNLLGVGVTTATIAIDRANAVDVSFGGVVASLAVALNPTSVTVNAPANVTVVVTMLDADGNAIVGSQFLDANGNPIAVTLSDSDISGATKLSTTTLGAPGTVTLAYNGNGISSAIVAAGAPGVGPGRASLAVGSARTLWVASANATYVSQLVALQTGSGSTTPLGTITGPLTNQTSSYSLASDAAGNLYEGACATNCAINVFAPGANGNAAPTRSFASSTAPNNSVALGLAVRSSGDVAELLNYNIGIGNPGNQEIDVAPAGANGIAPPRYVIPNLIDIGAVHYDAAGELVASDFAGVLGSNAATTAAGALLVYPDGATSPSRTIAPDVSRAFTSPIDLAADSNGYRYLVNPAQSGIPCNGRPGEKLTTDSVFVYAPGASEYAPPARIIGGSGSGMNQPFEARTDAAGNVYVLNFECTSSPNLLTGTVVINEYVGGASGSNTPIRTAMLPSFPVIAGYDVPYLAVGPDGTILVALTHTAAGLPGQTAPPPDSFYVFAPGATQPTRTFTSSAIGYLGPVAIDPSTGNLLVYNVANAAIFPNPPGPQSSQVLVFAATSSGSATPLATITLNGINDFSSNSSPFAFLTDATGNFWLAYVPNVLGTQISEFAKTGGSALRSFTTSSLQPSGFALEPNAAAVDVVSLRPPYEMETYPTATSGTVAASARIRPAVNGCFLPGAMDTDVAGNFYVSCNGDGTIRVYDPTLARQLRAIQQLPDVSDMVVDLDGTVYAATGDVPSTVTTFAHARRSSQRTRPLAESVANTNAVQVYPSGASGITAPSLTLTGGSAINGIHGLAFGGLPGTAIPTTVTTTNRIVLAPAGPLAFNATGAPAAQTLTASEQNYTGSFTALTSAPGVVTVSPTGSNGGFTITPLAPGAVTIFISDSTGQAANIVAYVNSTSLTINARSRRQ